MFCIASASDKLRICRRGFFGPVPVADRPNWVIESPLESLVVTAEVLVYNGPSLTEVTHFARCYSAGLRLRKRSGVGLAPHFCSLVSPWVKTAFARRMALLQEQFWQLGPRNQELKACYSFLGG